MSCLRGSATMERLPSARGPNSIRPWNQPTTSPAAIRSATRGKSASSDEQFATRARQRAVPRRAATSEYSGPVYACSITKPRGLPSVWFQTWYAAPMAMPLSPAAGWMYSVVEGGLGTDAAVRHRVQRDAAGEAELRGAGGRLRDGDGVEVDVLEDRLERAGDVLVVLRQLALRLRARSRRRPRGAARRPGRSSARRPTTSCRRPARGA